jgi:hypothetical protein
MMKNENRKAKENPFIPSDATYIIKHKYIMQCPD